MSWYFDSDFDEEDSIEEEPIGMDVSSGSILYNYVSSAPNSMQV